MYNEKPGDQINILDLFETNELVKICAPMVRYSKLQFRTLLREYGCDLCYTPMILADSFCLSDKARKNEFTTNLVDSPLVVQFAAKTVYDFVGASYMVSPYCNGVDLNCGCPQHWAKQMGVGCALLNKPEVIADLISQCRNRITKPFSISVKLRIFKDIRRTVELCRQIEKAGASYISVHARVPTQHTGEINLDALRLIAENVHCPVVSNGGVNNLEDCYKLQEETKCKGVMVANGLLTNPTLFTGKRVDLECVQRWMDICYNSTLTTESYFDSLVITDELRIIPERPLNLTFQCFHHHLVFMLEKVLPRSKRRIFNNLQTFHDVLVFLNDYFKLRPKLFDADVFEKYRILDLNYRITDQLYKELKLSFNDNLIVKNTCSEYCLEGSDGKFFKTKVASDESESDDYNLADVFV